MVYPWKRFETYLSGVYPPRVPPRRDRLHILYIILTCIIIYIIVKDCMFRLYVGAADDWRVLAVYNVSRLTRRTCVSWLRLHIALRRNRDNNRRRPDESAVHVCSRQRALLRLLLVYLLQSIAFYVYSVFKCTLIERPHCSATYVLCAFDDNLKGIPCTFILVHFLYPGIRGITQPYIIAMYTWVCVLPRVRLGRRDVGFVEFCVCFFFSSPRRYQIEAKRTNKK